MLAGGDDEVTLLRTENRLLKELLRGLMANKDAPPVGAFVGRRRINTRTRSPRPPIHQEIYSSSRGTDGESGSDGLRKRYL